MYVMPNVRLFAVRTALRIERGSEIGVRACSRPAAAAAVGRAATYDVRHVSGKASQSFVGMRMTDFKVTIDAWF